MVSTRRAKISVICSARVLNEGVDIPQVNTIWFADARKSTIDIIQCIGRGTRLYKNDEKCNIIIPVHFEGKDYNFGAIKDILVALGTVDNRLVEYFCLKINLFYL
jgi:predicted helicase